MNDFETCKKFAEDRRWRFESTLAANNPQPGTAAAVLHTPDGPVTMMFMYGGEITGKYQEVMNKYK